MLLHVSLGRILGETQHAIIQTALSIGINEEVQLSSLKFGLPLGLFVLDGYPVQVDILLQRLETRLQLLVLSLLRLLLVDDVLLGFPESSQTRFQLLQLNLQSLHIVAAAAAIREQGSQLVLLLPQNVLDGFDGFGRVATSPNEVKLGRGLLDLLQEGVLFLVDVPDAL